MGRRWLRVVALGLALTTVAGPALAEGETRLDARLERRVVDHRLGRDVGFIVLDEAGRVIAEHRADHPMQPASNMKLVTAITAIAAFGADHRFPTTVLRGKKPNHVIVQGGGDPLLSRASIIRLSVATAKHFSPGDRVVVHVDGDVFPRPTSSRGWITGFLGRTVGGVQALAIDGDRSRWRSRNAAALFVGRLRSSAIRATLGSNEDAAAEAEVLARIPGHTVAESVARMLNRSDSTIAEMLFRQVARATGRRGTWEDARAATVEVIQSLGVDPMGMSLVDGSGLSRDDAISARFVAQLIHVAKVQQRAKFASIFRSYALPVAGRTGTLSTGLGRYSTAPSRCARGRVQAKTGTIFATIALSGVARTRISGLRVFSILVNHRPTSVDRLQTRRAVDGLAATVMGCWE